MLVKIGKYIEFCADNRSYLLWPPVIVDFYVGGRRFGDFILKTTKKAHFRSHGVQMSGPTKLN